MKYFLTIVSLFLVLQLQAQKQFNASITYARKTVFENKADSIKYVKMNYGTDIMDMIMQPVKEKYLVKDDSVLINYYYRSKEILKEMRLSTKGRLQIIDMVSGSTYDSKDWSYNKYKRFKSYKRIESEDETILGRKCTAWVSKRKKGWRKVWLTDVDGVLPKTKDAEIFINNQLVLKQVTFINNYQQREKLAVAIEVLPEVNFAEMIKKNTEADIKWKYEPITENNELNDNKIKVGETAPDVYYREVLENGTKHLYESTQKSKYTMLEFWGTWCMPCLAATPKIKALRDKFDIDQLSIISLNSRDKIEAKVKKVIKRKEMNWQHGYATDKLISIFNDNRTFPRVILIDQNNKVLLIGNPHKEIEKIEQIINGELGKL
ncbi:TlpA family protein disulfide reductase [Ancylomarina sp. DW003]|nr:TlpA disulfide reductase family protein [Ancylomarina sp. DW003]MDE5422490.1 TlpA family protein disulfide reductase [Ancylomarina sp. DW003]